MSTLCKQRHLKNMNSQVAPLLAESAADREQSEESEVLQTLYVVRVKFEYNKKIIVIIIKKTKFKLKFGFTKINCLSLQ